MACTDSVAACGRAEDGSGLNEPYRCFSALCNDRRCENCISMRVVDEMQDALAKSTYRMNDALVEHLDIARGSGDETAPVRMANGELHQIQIRHIASGPDADAFAITPIAVG